MTTYKYSNSNYTRKHLGLSQAKKLIETFPILDLNKERKNEFKYLIKRCDAEGIIAFVKSLKKQKELPLWD